MRVLIIEDDSEFVAALVEIVIENVVGADVLVARSRNSAEEILKKNFFDLVLLDLKIPTTDDELDQDPLHGHSVFATARLEMPGTPIIVLTGSSGEDFIQSLLEHSEKADIWGGGILQMVSFHRKHLLDSFPEVLRIYSKQMEALSVIELRRNNVNLSMEEDRLVRIFSRRVGGARCAITQIGGGLSGSKVLRLVVTNSSGGVIHHVVCKLSSRDVIKDEGERYNRHVARLPPEATPRKLEVIEYGAGNKCGVFYGLADGFTSNAFDIVTSSAEQATLLVKATAELMEKWTSKSEGPIQVKNIRQRFLSDDQFAAMRDSLEIQWVDGFERQVIQTIHGCSHGDLHGLNILVSQEGVPTLIDYGDVADGPVCIDPITLELSLFFHPEGPLRASEWPSNTAAESWGDLEIYLEGCPFPDFIRQCREWAVSVAAGDREIAAVAYAYVVRQLKYEGTNHERVRAILRGIKKLYEQT